MDHYNKKKSSKIHPSSDVESDSDVNEPHRRDIDGSSRHVRESGDVAIETNKNHADAHHRKTHRPFKANVLSVLVGAKEHIGKWAKYATNKAKTPSKGTSEARHAREGPCSIGTGLGDLDETYTPKYHFGTMASSKAASKQLHEYFKKLASDTREGVRVNLDHVDYLLQRGACIDWPDKYGQTIFHEVVRIWHVDVAQYLVENGWDINATDNYSRTPLHVAAIVDNPHMVKFLIKNGANKEAETKEEHQTPVYYAAKNDSPESLLALIKGGCEYKLIRDYKGRTPLQLAAEYGISRVVSILLEHEAPARVEDDQGQAALVYIISKTKSLASDALDQFYVTEPINRKQYTYLNNMEPLPPDIENPSPALTPLEVIINNSRYDLVTHEAVKQLISQKWKKFGKCGAIVNLIYSLVFCIVWTTISVYPSWETRRVYILPVDVWRILLWALAAIMSVYEVAVEIIEYRRSKKRLARWKEWRKDQIDLDTRFYHPCWPEEQLFLGYLLMDVNYEKTRYIKDWWNIFDWFCYFFLLVCILTHVIDVCLPVRYVVLGHVHIRIMAFTLIFIWIRLMKVLRAFSVLGPFIVMIGQLIYDFMRFAFLYINFYIPYVAAFWMIHGGVKTRNVYLENPPADNRTSTTIIIPGYGTVKELLFSVVRLTLVDDYPYDAMQEVDPYITDFLLLTWFAISTILCINLFIALMSDTFQRVYDNAQANALMQKALSIMNIEESLSFKQRLSVIRHLHYTCSPLTTFYDEGLERKQESELKKVAFQVKYELEEIREWFYEKFGEYTSQGSSLLRSSSQAEVIVLKHEVQGIREDIAELKDMMRELVASRGGGNDPQRLRRTERWVELTDAVQEEGSPFILRDDKKRYKRKKRKQRRKDELDGRRADMKTQDDLAQLPDPAEKGSPDEPGDQKPPDHPPAYIEDLPLSDMEHPDSTEA